MEVREQGADHAEFETRIDKDVRFARAGVDWSLFPTALKAFW